jgi:uroporphyrinogen decarboxylase
LRERSETPDIADEVSLQCHRAFGMDEIIIFSDILTPLPCLGIDLDVVKGVCPAISTDILCQPNIEALERVSFEEKTLL